MKVLELTNLYKNIPSIDGTYENTESRPSKRKRLKNRQKRQARKSQRGK